ncbi:MAG TPA: ParB/RepB/Spo0J family partition protein [Anaerolineae bacterium]|nr:ParB/RepB/Spo0J family partition protein [Anaerolineae bacterium]
MTNGSLQLEAFTDLLEGAQGAQRVVEIGLTELTPSPVQVRAPFDPESREEDGGLVESVRQDGVIQPLLVVLGAGGGSYQLIDGHRRWAAARAAGLPTAPCIVLTLDEVEAAFQTGISNLQRRDLTPLEEGRQYVELMRVSGLSARELARRLGKPARTVQQRVALTTLPPRVQELLEQGRLSPNQALGCRHEAWGAPVAELAAERGLSRTTIDQVMRRLQERPGSRPQEVVETLAKTDGPASRQSRRRRAKPRKPAVDYQALVTGLDVDLSPEQRSLLAEYAGIEQLDPGAVRWAALILAGTPTMTASGAVAYAGQLARAPVGRALRAITGGLETLERRAQKRRQLTPNLVVAARAVIADVTSRLTRVGAALAQAVGLACAGAASPREEEQE